MTTMNKYFSRIDSLLTVPTRKTAYNSTLAIGGVSSPLDSFVVAESSQLRIKLSAVKPAHRQSAKRYKPF
jgi:hypothetical protein